MQEILEQLIGFLKGIWNKRWYAMAVAWIICILGWGFVFQMPDKFQSTGKLYIDTQSLLKPLLKGLAIDTNVEQQVKLMVKTLLARPNVVKIINSADLDLHIENDAQMDGLISSLQSKIIISKTGKQNLYSISVDDTDPEIAQRIVQATLTVFVENTLGEGRDESNSARKFIEKQIADYEKRLEQSEDRLTVFKQKNYELLSSSGDYYGQMKSDLEQLDQAKLELKEALEQQTTLQDEIEDLEDDIDSYDIMPKKSSSLASSYDERIDKLKTDVDNILMNYTEKHPDVISIRRVLKELEAKRQQELAEFKASGKKFSGVSKDVGENPVYQQLKITLGQANAQVKTLKVRISEYEKRYERMKELVNTIPEIDAKLVALNRDYSVTKENYNQLLKRRESARISRSVEQTTDSVQFRVIEQPRVVEEPVGPNRILFSSLVLLLGLGVGVAFAFVLSQAKPVFTSINSVISATSYPVLGMVSAISSPAQRQRRLMLFFSFFLLLLALLSLYGAIIAWYYF